MESKEIFEQILTEMKSINQRFDKIETDVSEIKAKVDSIDIKVDRRQHISD